MWEPFKFFVGSWQGTGEGHPGKCLVERTYGFVLNGNYLLVRSRSTYPPQEKNPSGEVHEDWGFYSYMKARKTYAFRQFHMENFITTYELQSMTPDGDTIIFLSEAIENIPAGYRARESYIAVNPDEFIEVFELAAPGQDFTVYSETQLKRK